MRHLPLTDLAPLLGVIAAFWGGVHCALALVNAYRTVVAVLRLRRAYPLLPLTGALSTALRLRTGWSS